MPGLSYAGAVERLYELQRFGIKLGLEKITSLLARLGNPHHSFTSCHVAGTNGKGTAAAVVDALLRAHGTTCGLYTSPHLVSLRERIAAGGDKVPESFVAAWVAEQIDWILESRVTFFEAVTALAFDWFRSARVQAASVEVGLGGRFDATSVIVPAVSVITSIGLEHTRHLGRTLARIAAEKAGIARPGVPLVCGERKRRPLEAIAAACREKGSPLLLLDDEVSCRSLSFDGRGTVFSYRSRALSLRRARAPLFGSHALRNVCLGLRAAEIMLENSGREPEPGSAAAALEGLNWPGRFQRVRLEPGCEVVLDAAHNPAAASRLVHVFRRLYPGRKAVAVLALAGDKDYRKFLGRLAAVADRFIFPRVDFGRADSQDGCRPPEELTEYVRRRFPGTRAQTAGDVRQALDFACELARGNPVLVSGSFHTVGAAMQELGIEP